MIATRLAIRALVAATAAISAWGLPHVEVIAALAVRQLGQSGYPNPLDAGSYDSALSARAPVRGSRAARKTHRARPKTPSDRLVPPDPDSKQRNSLKLLLWKAAEQRTRTVPSDRIKQFRAENSRRKTEAKIRRIRLDIEPGEASMLQALIKQLNLSMTKTRAKDRISRLKRTVGLLEAQAAQLRHLPHIQEGIDIPFLDEVPDPERREKLYVHLRTAGRIRRQIIKLKDGAHSPDSEAMTQFKLAKAEADKAAWNILGPEYAQEKFAQEEDKVRAVLRVLRYTLLTTDNTRGKRENWELDYSALCRQQEKPPPTSPSQEDAIAAVPDSPSQRSHSFPIHDSPVSPPDTSHPGSSTSQAGPSAQPSRRSWQQTVMNPTPMD